MSFKAAIDDRRLRLPAVIIREESTAIIEEEAGLNLLHELRHWKSRYQ